MIPAGDYVRDALAAVFLLTALNTDWSTHHHPAGTDYLVPVTLLSILSLALPYLSIASVLPRALFPRRLRYVRLAANVPYVVLVLMTVIRGYGGGRGAAEIGAGRGVGVGVALGLVGVVLAAQDRAGEVRGGTTGRMLWPGVIAVLAGLGVALSLVSTVLYMVEYAGEASWGEMAIFIVDVIFFAGVPMLAVRGLIRGDAVWRDVAVVIGGVGMLAALWAEGAGETMGDVWSLRLAGPQVLLWPAMGAAAAAPGIVVVLHSAAAGMRWVNLAGRLMQIVTLVALIAILLLGFQIVENSNARGIYLTAIVLSLVVLVLAAFARSVLVKDAMAWMPAAVGAAVGLVLVAVVIVSVLGFSEAAEIRVDFATILSVWFIFAAVGVVALVAPSSLTQESSAVDADEKPSEPQPADGSHIKAEDTSIWQVTSGETGTPHPGSTER